MGKKLRSFTCTVVSVEECKNGTVVINFQADQFCLYNRTPSICIERNKLKKLPEAGDQLHVSYIRDMAFWSGVQIIASFIMEASMNGEVIISVSRHSREIMIHEACWEPVSY